jgi:hypothetical protein
MRFIVSVVVIFLTSLPVFAQSEPDYEALLKSFQKLQKEIKQSATNAATCDVPPIDKCSFGDYCQKLRSQGQNFYLYKNKSGKTVPNYYFNWLVGQASACLDQPLPETDSEDPFVNPLKLSKSNPEYKSEAERSQKIFKDVQAHAVALLESRKTAANAAQIDVEIKRLQTVKMTSPLFKDKAELALAYCVFPAGATYHSDGNSILMCPQLLNLPDATLFSILSHELSHSIDPCNAHQEIAGGSVAAGQNPFKDVVKCLQQPKSFGAKVVSEENVLALLNNQEASFPKSAEIKALYNQRRKEASAHFQTHQYCRSFSKDADMQEGFADWMSAKLIAQKVSELSGDQAKEYAFESQLFMAATQCQNVRVAAMNRVSAALKKNCPMFTESKKDLLNPENFGREDQDVPHPKSSRRVDKILFAPPEIQKALGCKAPGDLTVCE